MVFTQYCNFGYKITTKIWNTQGFLQENANLFKFYTLKAALIPPFVVQSRSHLVRITDIYVPSFSYVLFLAVFRVFLSSDPPDLIRHLRSLFPGTGELQRKAESEVLQIFDICK